MALRAGRDLTKPIKEIQINEYINTATARAELCKLQGIVGPNGLYIVEQQLTECIAAFCHLSFHSHDNKQWKFTGDILKNVIIH